MLVSEFDYHLPPELIAQQPLADRAASRMMVLDRYTGAVADLRFRDLPGQLRAGDLLVFNNTAVIPARLYGHRRGMRSRPLSPHNPATKRFLQGQVEVLLTKHIADAEWEALVRPGRKIGVGEEIFFDETENGFRAQVVARGEYGARRVRLLNRDVSLSPAAVFDRLDRLGHVPLPPYIDRPDTPADHKRYQTVFARERGSAAAPTAGLHFTPEVLSELHQRGIETTEITLHVGLGTFQPLRDDVVERNRLHKETFNISEAAAKAVNRAKSEGRRVIAVGTTTVRALEFVAQRSTPGQLSTGSGEAEIFIYPGFQFRVVDALLTNFHLPRSSLLMLVSAFASRDAILRAYEHAVHERYRFFSYGDCTFIA